MGTGWRCCRSGARMRAAPVWRALMRAGPRPPSNSNGCRGEEGRLEGLVDVHAFTPGELAAFAGGPASRTCAWGGEELVAGLFGWANRTLEASADPDDVPWAWRVYAYRGYLLLQSLDRSLLEPRLPPALFYNLLLSARAPSRARASPCAGTPAQPTAAPRRAAPSAASRLRRAPPRGSGRRPSGGARSRSRRAPVWPQGPMPGGAAVPARRGTPDADPPPPPPRASRWPPAPAARRGGPPQGLVGAEPAAEPEDQARRPRGSPRTAARWPPAPDRSGAAAQASASAAATAARTIQSVLASRAEKPTTAISVTT